MAAPEAAAELPASTAPPRLEQPEEQGRGKRRKVTRKQRPSDKASSWAPPDTSRHNRRGPETGTRPLPLRSSAARNGLGRPPSVLLRSSLIFMAIATQEAGDTATCGLCVVLFGSVIHEMRCCADHRN